MVAVVLTVGYHENVLNSMREKATVQRSIAESASGESRDASIRNPLSAIEAPAAPVDLNLAIETPENVVLTFRLAGPATRLAAYLIDFILHCAIAFGAFLFFVCFLSSVLGLLSVGMWVVLLFLLNWFYFALLEGFFRGKTPGKSVFNLRVIHEGGHPITFWSALLRNLIRAADAMPLFAYVIPVYGVGFLTASVSGSFRRLGDLAAGTIVIEESRVELPTEPIILERIRPLSRAEIGGFVPTSKTLALIEEFLGRRYVLTHKRGHEMAALLAGTLARRLQFRGDAKQVKAYPMAFLAKVYATFHRSSTAPKAKSQVPRRRPEAVNT